MAEKWLPKKLATDSKGKVTNEKIVKITDTENGREKTVELFLKCGDWEEKKRVKPVFYKFSYTTKKDLSNYENPEDVPIDDKCTILFDVVTIDSNKKDVLFDSKWSPPISFSKSQAFSNGNLTFKTLHRDYFPNVGQGAITEAIESFFKNKHNLKDKQKEVCKWLGFDDGKTFSALKEEWINVYRKDKQKLQKDIEELKKDLADNYVKKGEATFNHLSANEKKNYIKKSNVTFNHLSANEKKNYIKKSDVTFNHLSQDEKQKYVEKGKATYNDLSVNEKKNYIKKSDVTFNHLSQNEKNDYIKKSQATYDDLSEEEKGKYLDLTKLDIKKLNNLESIKKEKQYVKMTVEGFLEMYDRMMKYGNFEQKKSEEWKFFRRFGCACFSTKDLDFDNSNEIISK